MVIFTIARSGRPAKIVNLKQGRSKCQSRSPKKIITQLRAIRHFTNFLQCPLRHRPKIPRTTRIPRSHRLMANIPLQVKHSITANNPYQKLLPNRQRRANLRYLMRERINIQTACSYPISFSVHYAN